MRKFHLSVNIEGLLLHCKRKKMNGLLVDEKGKKLTDKEARKFLAKCQAKGWKYLPADDCDGFDHFGKGCPGHIVTGRNDESE